MCSCAEPSAGAFATAFVPPPSEPGVGGRAGLQEIKIDCSADPATPRIETANGRYIVAERVPPGADLLLYADDSDTPIRLRGGDKLIMLGPQGARSLKFTWTALPSAVLRDDLRYARVLVTDQAPPDMGPERVYTVPTPAPGFTTRQGKIAVTGTAVNLPDLECEEIRITAGPANAATLFVGGQLVENSIDGDSTKILGERGEPITAGQTKVFPVPNAAKLWINGTINDVWSLYVPARRR